MIWVTGAANTAPARQPLTLLPAVFDMRPRLTSSAVTAFSAVVVVLDDDDVEGGPGVLGPPPF